MSSTAQTISEFVPSTDSPFSDADQAKADLLSPRHLEIYKETKAAEDLPGLGRHYCIECSRWFETDTSLVVHAKGKPHKRRSVTSALILPTYC